MAQKISRKELLKDDQFIERAPDFIDWLEQNKTLIIRTAVGVLVIVLAGGAWSIWSNHRRDAAAALFVEGQAAYRPRTATGAAPPAPKLDAALAAFEQAATRGGNSGVGVTASFYRANVLLQLGRPKEAVPVLESVVSAAPTPALEAAARAVLANAYESAGEPDKAAETYTQLAADPDGIYPAEAALMSLASVREGQGKTEEAKQAYRDVLAKFAESAAAAEAKTQLERLEGKAQ